MVLLCGCVIGGSALAVDPLADAERQFAAGDVVAAADTLAHFLRNNPGKNSEGARALLLLGQALERGLSTFNAAAEDRCYRRNGGGARCMERFAAELNAKYGAGAFAYAAEIIVLRYTGSHYRTVAEEWTDQAVSAEAGFRLLEKNLIGTPDEVLARVQEFLARVPQGEWNRRGRLLWARLNEDIWWIHRNWAWLLYNWSASEDELIIRGEKFRKEALKAYEALLQGKKSDEVGKAARQEYELVKANKSDGILHGIVNESMVGKGK